MNSDATRDEVLAKLHEVAELSPDVRLGQLLANLEMLAEDRTGRSLWEIEDRELLRVIESHRRELARRVEAVA